MPISDVNVVVLTGRVGTDPETRDAGQSRLTRWRFATTDAWDDREKTSWVTCQVWNREGVTSFIGKGDMLTVSGRLEVQEYQDKNGNDRVEVVIAVDRIRKGGSVGDVSRDGPKSRPNPNSSEEDDLPW